MPGQHAPHRGLAAARHADEHDVAGAFGDGIGDGLCPVLPLREQPPQLAGALGLRRQHQQPVAAGNAQRLRLQQQAGALGVVNHVKHQLAVGKHFQRKRRLLHLRVHAHRGGVDHHGGVPVQVQVVIGVGPCAGNGDGVQPLSPKHGDRRFAGAAAAQHQGLLPVQAGDIPQHAREAVGVGVVAV